MIYDIKIILPNKKISGRGRDEQNIPKK